jgi:hypothetical protein
MLYTFYKPEHQAVQDTRKPFIGNAWALARGADRI